MRKMNIIVFSFIFLFLKIKSQVPQGSVINTCGKLGYGQPTGKRDCVESGEICCYVKIREKDKTADSDALSFCVSSPTEIERRDVESEILDYTGFNILDLACTNKSIFINYSMKFLLLITFIIF